MVQYNIFKRDFPICWEGISQILKGKYIWKCIYFLEY